MSAPPDQHAIESRAASSIPGHLEFLDGVRGFACFYVMFHHGTLDLPPSSSPIAAWLGKVFSQGHYAVDVFIVLSGYCLMLPLLRRPGPLPFWPFIRRRALRILPTYYAAMAFSLLLIATLVGKKTGTNWDYSLPVTPRDVLLHVLLVHEWSTRSAFHISSPFWSIGVEWKIYFLMPLLLALRNRYGAVKMVVMTLGFGYGSWLLIRQLNVLNPSPYGSSPHYIALFAMGMWAADWAVRGASVRTATARWAFAGISLVVVALTLLNEARATPVVGVQVMSGFVGLCAASGLGLLHAGSFPALRRIFSWRPAVYFGQLGFTIYLIHAPIAEVVSQYIIAPSPWSDNVRALLMPPIYLACTMAVAIPFFRFLERPFHALSRARAVRPAGIDAPARLEERGSAS